MCQAIIDMKKEAYDSGWTEGHNSGWTEGHNSGWTEGHDSGWTEGHNSGWTEGHDSGWTEGKENTVVMTVLRMHEENCSPEFISKITGVSIKKIDKIIQTFHEVSQSH